MSRNSRFLQWMFFLIIDAFKAQNFWTLRKIVTGAKKSKRDSKTWNNPQNITVWGALCANSVGTPLTGVGPYNFDSVAGMGVDYSQALAAGIRSGDQNSYRVLLFSWKKLLLVFREWSILYCMNCFRILGLGYMVQQVFSARSPDTAPLDPFLRDSWRNKCTAFPCLSQHYPDE